MFSHRTLVILLPRLTVCTIPALQIAIDAVLISFSWDMDMNEDKGEESEKKGEISKKTYTKQGMFLHNDHMHAQLNGGDKVRMYPCVRGLGVSGDRGGARGELHRLCGAEEATLTCTAHVY